MPGGAASPVAIGRQALSTLALRAFQLGASLLSTLLLARVLGAGEFGAYSYASSWLWLLANFATAGFTFASVRAVAQGLALGKHADVRSHIKTAYLLTVVLSVVAAALVSQAPELLFAESPALADAATLGVAFSPLLSLVLVAQAVLRGQGLNLRGLAGEQLILPALLVVLVGWIALGGPEWRSAERALYLYGGCLALAAVASLVLQWRSLPPELRHGAGSFDRRWLLDALPFLLVLGSVTLSSQFDVLVVGHQLGAHQTGVYAFAARLATLPALVVTVVAMPLSPAVAALFAKREARDLQRLIEKAALSAALGSSAVAAGVILGAPWLLPAIDPSLAAGHVALLILCLGRVAEAWFGPGGTVLTMTRHAWAAGIAQAIGALVSVALNLLLVGRHGIEGAAVATAVSCVLRGAAMWYWTRRQEGVQASAVEALWRLSRSG